MWLSNSSHLLSWQDLHLLTHQHFATSLQFLQEFFQIFLVFLLYWMTWIYKLSHIAWEECMSTHFYIEASHASIFRSLLSCWLPSHLRSSLLEVLVSLLQRCTQALNGWYFHLCQNGQLLWFCRHWCLLEMSLYAK